MRLLISLFSIVWLSAAVYGVVYLSRYENTPGPEPAVYPQTFPKDSSLHRSNASSTLIFFAHPKCPCTRASLSELSRLMAEVNGKLRVHIVFSIPPDTGTGFDEGELKDAAEALPGATILVDNGEVETDRFGANTSGLVLLYDAAGDLTFHGGITSSRGHEGDNAGHSAIYDLVLSGNTTNGSTPVYGCPLHSKDCRGEILDPL